MTPPKAPSEELAGQVSIDDYLSADFDTLVEGEVEVSLGGDQDATWALRKLAAIVKQKKANDSIAEAEAGRIARWLDEVNAPLRKQAAYLTTILEGYARHERETTGRKTIILPYGKIASRPAADKWDVDEDSFIAWAEGSGIADLVKVTKKPALTVIKGAFNVAEDGTVLTPEGEPVPGVTVTPAPDVNVTITTV